jgi:tetratricopeptide (TPR) repeat protein
MQTPTHPPSSSADDGSASSTAPELAFDASAGPAASARSTPPPIATNGDGETSAFDHPPATRTPAPANGGPELDAEARLLIATYEREAKARGNDRSAAPLFFEIGRIWEHRLKSLRNAAACYQASYRLDPSYRPNLAAARQLFARVGNWQMVEQLIDAHIAATDDAVGPIASVDIERRALILEKARLLSERLGRTTEACEILQSLGRVDTKDPGAFLALEALLSQSGENEALADLYERLAETISDVPLRVYFLTAGAVIREQSDHPELAAELYRRAFALDPTDPAAVSGVKAHAEREGRWGELLAALKAEADSEPGASGAAVLYQAARICLDRLGREGEALDLLLTARQRSPADPLILSELAHIHEHRGNYAELAEVLAARAQSCRNLHEAVDVRMRLGAIYEEHLGREEDAMACYRVVVASEPGHPQALAALGKLYYRRSAWAELLDTYEQEVTIASDPRQRAVKLYKTAEILDERLGRTDAAIARYNESLAQLPGYLPAQNNLARLLERLGRFSELCALLEQRVKDTPDLAQRISLRSEIGRLSEERLHDPERAVQAHRAILEEAPNHVPTIQSLARLSERTQRWTDLIWANEREAALAEDQRQVVSLLHRNGEILEEHLEDKDGAVEVYQKMLALSPTYLPGLKALGKLYAQKGRWQELVAMYRQQAEVASNPEDAAALTLKIGALFEDKLFREDSAIKAYEQALAMAPSCLPALAALQRIHRNRGDWPGLIASLRAEADVRADPLERASVVFQIGQIAEQGLKRPDLAIDAHQEVLRMAPDHGLALRELDRLYRAGGCWQELASVYERQLSVAPVGPSRVVPCLKLARLYAERLGDPARAAQCFESALQSAPDPDDALTALKGLERLQIGSGTRERRAELRSRLASHVKDRLLRAEMEILAGEDRETGADGAATEPRAQRGPRPDPAAADYRRALELQPENPRASAALEAVLRRSGDWARLSDLLQLRLSTTNGSANRAALSVELAQLFQLELRDSTAAMSAVEEGLRAEASSLPLLRMARALAITKGELGRAREAARAEADAVKDRELAIQALLWAGSTARDQLHDTEGAITDFRRVLDLDPLQAEATEQLGHLLMARGDQESIVEIQDRRARAMARSGDPSAADALEHSARRLASIGKEDEALLRLAQAVELWPEHAPSYVARAEILLSLDRGEEAVADYQRASGLISDPAQLAEIHYQLGLLLQDTLQDTARAATHFQAAAATQPTHLRALERLALAQEINGNWTGADYALDMLERSTADAATKARALVAHARVLLDGKRDQAAALAKAQNAHRLESENLATLSMLCTLEQRLRDWAAAAESCERLANLNEATDPAASRSFRLRAGEIYLAELNRPAEAIASYRRALDLDPSDEVARVALADVLTKDRANYLEAKAEHRWLLHQDAGRADSYRMLLRIFLDEQQNDRAYCAVAVLAFLDPDDEAAATVHAELRRRLSGQPTRPLNPELREKLLVHPDARGPLTAVLRIIGDHLDKVVSWPSSLYSLQRGNRLKPEHPTRQLCDRLTADLACGELAVYSGKGSDLVVLPTSPPTLVVGPDALANRPEPAQRFLLGRLIGSTPERSHLTTLVDPALLEDAVGAAIRLAHPEALVSVGRPDAELQKRLAKVLPRKARRDLEEIQPGAWCAPADGGAEWLTALIASADRSGLALAGDIEAALTAAASLAGVTESQPFVSRTVRSGSNQLLETPALADLCVFAVSDELFRLRNALGLALA